MYEVRIKQVEPQRYDSVTRRLRVDELDGFIASTVAELGAGDAPPFAVYHGRVNEQEDGPVEMCVPRAGGARELPAGEVAYTVAEGKQCEFPEILGAYDAVARWVQEQGRELAGPPREIYLDGPNSPTRMEIDWPLVRLDSRAEEH